MDTYRHKGLRKKLVDILIQKGITNKKVLSSIANIPRHLFLDSAFEEQAYMDKALPIICNQTISQPYTVAFQTELVDPQPTDKILEIGTGSGYQAAVLSTLCQKIYSIERHKRLFEHTAKLLPKIGFSKVRTLFGDGYKGSIRFAPFDKIIITAGASTIPELLLSQLKIGGFMIIPFGESEKKTMLRITRTTEAEYSRESFGSFKFVPFLEGVQN